MRPVAVVTGGNTGIGAAIAERLIADGYDVACLSRRPAPARAHFESVVVDLLDSAATAACATELVGRREVAIFVHNAGAVRANLIDKTSATDLAALSQLHLGAALTLAQAFIPGMQARRFGRIVLVSSRAAMGLATRTAYAATKSGMIGMARTWAMELGPKGLTVNTVAPGPIESTDMFHEILPRGDPRIAKLAAKVPVGRLGTPEDVARAVAFFVAPEAGFVTGQLLYVCGGTSVGTVAL